ncbi:MAG: galactokinase [Treponema sp.]
MEQQAFIQFLTDLPEDRMKTELETAFSHRYGTSDKPIITIASPARINLIGEHIDYNGGKVFPAAINRYLYVLMRKRSDMCILYDDIRFPGQLSFSISEPLPYQNEYGYANYLNGMLTILKNNNYTIDSGFEVLIFSKLPAGGGISSSSALEIGFGLAVSEAFGLSLNPIELAKIGQQSEHAFMNVQCGIMDQFSIAMGKKDHAILLDTATLDYEYIPFLLNGYRIVVINSNKQRTLANSKYNERRSECTKGLQLLQQEKTIRSLCGLTVNDLPFVAEKITDPIIFKRVRHCITENDRVKEAVAALKAGDIPRLGSLLKASHESLKNDYEVTGFELDTIAERANSFSGCVGARMTGAGFGGCAIALVESTAIDDFIRHVKDTYTQKTGLIPSFFACEASSGARKL